MYSQLCLFYYFFQSAVVLVEESYLIVSIKTGWLGLPHINLQLEKSRIQLSDLMQQSDIFHLCT